MLPRDATGGVPCEVCGGPLGPTNKLGVCAGKPDCYREYHRRWYHANREKENERNRLYRAENQDKERERQRRYYEANREKEANRHHLYEHAHRKGRNKRQRVARANGYEAPARRAHWATKVTLWHDQGECCYLCGDSVALEATHLDHDHRCCPRFGCSTCIRGATCGACNVAIGYLRDDPDRMERVARNLRAKLAEVEERLAAKPVQNELFSGS